MKPCQTAALVATLLTPSLAAGQAFVRLGAGLTLSSTLVGEVIVNPVSLRQSLAPTGSILVGWRLPSGYRIGLEARYATGSLQVHGSGAGGDDLGGLATLAVGVVADGPIRGAFRWEAALGALRYLPEFQSGPFRDGNPTPLLIGAGLSWSRTVSGSIAVVLAARASFHRFSTQRLTSDGYTGSEGVGRGGLTLALERGF